MARHLGKGLGVFTYGGVRGVVLEQVDDSIHYVLPLAIQAPLSIRLLAVWAYRGRYRPRVRTRPLSPAQLLRPLAEMAAQTSRGASRR